MFSRVLCSAETPLYSMRWFWYLDSKLFRILLLKEYVSGNWASCPAHMSRSWWKAITPSSDKYQTCMYRCMACCAIAVVINAWYSPTITDLNIQLQMRWFGCSTSWLNQRSAFPFRQVPVTRTQSKFLSTPVRRWILINLIMSQSGHHVFQLFKFWSFWQG